MLKPDINLIIVINIHNLYIGTNRGRILVQSVRSIKGKVTCIKSNVFHLIQLKEHGLWKSMCILLGLTVGYPG